MWWKSISRSNLAALLGPVQLLVVSVVLAAPEVLAAAPGPQITVIYPKPEQTIAAADSTFIFGHVPPPDGDWSYVLTINEHPVPVHRGGGFLAFLPIEPGEFVFELKAELTYRKRESYRSRLARHGAKVDTNLPESLAVAVVVDVPCPRETLDPDSLRIAGDYRPPSGDIALSAGERLCVSFHGTAGCRAWFSVDTVIDSVAMSEVSPRTQPFWGEAVFGEGAVPESLLVRGIYRGFIDIADSVRVDSARIRYHLAPPSIQDVVMRLFGPASEEGPAYDMVSYLRLARCDTAIAGMSGYRVSLNASEYPRGVRFTDSVQILRHGPRKGYFSIFQPEGVEALAVGREGDWLKLRLSSTQTCWAHQDAVELMAAGILPPHSYLRSVRTYSHQDRVVVEFPLSGKHPFRVVEEDPRSIRIELFGVTTDTDWIRYDTRDSLIEIATWSQPEADRYEFHLRLTQDIWGFDTYYRGSTLCLQLNRPPEKRHSLRGKTIVIDPGHSLDLGAVGPTGYTEAEANLGIALRLRDELRWQGANVILTRDDARDLPLYDRPAIAKGHDADLFVSIHNNAVPDGVNPYASHGTSSYYYHPHSIGLARSIHGELTKATGLPDRGMYYGNLAVNRPTQYPAVLVECAFMMIPEQEALLKTDKFRRKIAEAVSRGIRKFLKEYDHE